VTEFHGGVIAESIDDAKESGAHPRKVIGMDELEKALTQQVLRFAAEHSDRGPILGNDRTAAVDDCDQIEGAVEEGLEPHFALPQILPRGDN
jgi:hypothetical protein